MQIERSKRGLGCELVWGAEKDRDGVCSAFLTTPCRDVRVSSCSLWDFSWWSKGIYLTHIMILNLDQDEMGILIRQCLTGVFWAEMGYGMEEAAEVEKARPTTRGEW